MQFSLYFSILFRLYKNMSQYTFIKNTWYTQAMVTELRKSSRIFHLPTKTRGILLQSRYSWITKNNLETIRKLSLSVIE